jgi:hypothetical protein
MKKTQTSAAIGARKIAQTHIVNEGKGMIYDRNGVIVGSNIFEPRVSVRIQTPNGPKKYGVRTARVVAFVKFGPEALNPNVQVRHRDGNKFNNAGDNLMLVRRHRGSLNASTVRRIRNMADRGLSGVEIAQRTGASRYQVSRIANGEAYTSVR